MVCSLAACGKDSGESGTSSTDATESSSQESGDGEETSADGATYTYRDTTSSISTWNPTDWLYSSESDIIAYTTSTMYAFNMNEAKDGYVVEPEAAVGMPEDVTAEYAGNETYGVPADATDSYAYKVQLREDVVWDDGTPVTADDYVYTVAQFINPDMKNYRASSFYSGPAALANAAAYFTGGMVNVYNAEDGSFAEVEDADMYWSLSSVNAYLNTSIDEDYGNYPDYYIREDGSNIYDDLVALAGDEAYVPLTDEAKALLDEINEYVYGSEHSDDNYLYFCFYEGESKPFEEVGVIKNDDYSITFVFANPINEFDFEYNIGTMAVLNEEKYEANKVKTGSIEKSSYNTSVETSASYGPYKVVTYQEGKEIKLAKNESWYGYTDGNHEGQYQTTNIDLTQIDEHTTQLNLFLQGNLDKISLTNDDMDTYGNSDYVYYEPQTYTYNYTLDSDFDALKAEEIEGENRTILSYMDFRHAISLCVDRSDYVKSCTSNSDPAFGLLNSVYICDPQNGTLYRDCEQAQEALKNVYNVEDINDLTGYDKEEAGKLFQAAYEQCLADGNISETDQVVLDFHVYGSDTSYVKIVDFLQNAVNEATVGTDLDGRVTINLVEDQQYYDNLLTGSVDIALTSWGGNDLNPYGMMECYCDANYKGEYGYDPYTETATINVNGEEITMTLNEWLNELIYGTYAVADLDTRNTVLAGMEEALLSHYDSIPVYALTESFLYSHRIVPGSSDFINSIIAFGGIQYMTYTMNDEEWAAYCAENNNNLTY